MRSPSTVAPNAAYTPLPVCAVSHACDGMDAGGAPEKQGFSLWFCGKIAIFIKIPADMKKILSVFAMVCLCTCVWAQNPDSLLRAAYAADQAVRLELIRLSSQQPLQVDSLLAADAQVQQVDARNQLLVLGLLDECGWPEGLSAEANRAICIVLDHAQPDDLKRYMPLVERQAGAGIVEKSMYATMLDRMLMHEGLRQRYGTQTVVKQAIDSQTGAKSGRCYVWPVEDAAGLDSLRAEAGLPPMGEYVKMVGEAYAVECVWDPSLGIDDMPVKYPQGGE